MRFLVNVSSDFPTRVKYIITNNSLQNFSKLNRILLRQLRNALEKSFFLHIFVGSAASMSRPSTSEHSGLFESTLKYANYVGIPPAVWKIILEHLRDLYKELLPA